MNETGVIYARISPSKNAKGGQSTENQEAACRKEAERREVQILKVFVDTARSGTTRKGRPAFREALKFVVENNVQYLFVTETDRFARNSADHKLVKEFLRNHGCKLVSISQSFTESEEPSDELTDGIVSLMNEHYSKSYSVKTRRGMQTKVDNGGWPHKAKPGYLNVAVADGFKVRRLIRVNDATRHLFEEAFRLYSTGNYNHNVLNSLMYDKGMRSDSGKKMAPSKFIKMLADPFYTGKIIYKGKEYSGSHEAIIDQATFDLCQEVREQHNQFANRERKHSERFFLRQILRCGICGGKITAELHEKKGLAYYHCSLTKKKHSNAGQNVRADELEGLISDEFRKIQLTKPLMERIVARAKDILSETHNGVDKQRRGMQNRIMKVEARRKNVETDRADRVIDTETYQRLSEDIKVELLQLQKGLNELAEKREDTIDVFSRLMELTDDLHETYNKAEPHLKRHLLTLFFKSISIRDKAIHNVEYTEIIAALRENRGVIIRDGWLGLIDDFRNANWAEIVKYPQLVMQQLDQLLAPMST